MLSSIVPQINNWIHLHGFFIFFLSLKHCCNKNSVHTSWSTSVGYSIKKCEQFKLQWMLHGNFGKRPSLVANGWGAGTPLCCWREQERGEDVCLRDYSFQEHFVWVSGRKLLSPPLCWQRRKPWGHFFWLPRSRWSHSASVQAAVPWGMEINVGRSFAACGGTGTLCSCVGGLGWRQLLSRQ